MKPKFCIQTVLLVLTVLSPSSFGQQVPLGENEHSSVGYPTVEAALTALRNKPGVDLSVQSGWTIVSDREENTLWSFTPKTHAAYPAVVKRTTYERNFVTYIGMSVLCQAEKAPCDQLVRDFNELNTKVIADLRAQAQQRAPADPP